MKEMKPTLAMKIKSERGYQLLRDKMIFLGDIEKVMTENIATEMLYTMEFLKCLR